MPIAFAILAGTLFGAGLAISDMVNPERVLGFLDFAGRWDPTLAFVMAGGLAATASGYALIFRRRAPLIGGTFNLPTRERIDLSLVGGAAIFGVGWGLAGICPGPALTDLYTLQPKVFSFVAAMLIGMIVTNVAHAGLRTKKQATYSKNSTHQ